MQDEVNGPPGLEELSWQRLDSKGKVELTYVPIGEFEWTDDYSYLRTLTCKNHPTAKYFTKNPWHRKLTLVKLPDDEDIERSPTGECLCPFGDLVVVAELSQPPVESSKNKPGEEPE